MDVASIGIINTMRKTKVIWIFVLFLLALPIVHSSKYTVLNDSWEIKDQDQTCSNSLCVIEFNISNSKNQNRILPIEVFANPQPSNVKIYTNTTVGYKQGNLIGCVNISAPTNSTPRTKLINCTYNQINITKMLWSSLNSSIITGSFKGKSHKINTTGLSFISNEIKSFKIFLNTILNGITKFDILWHDPVIDSTTYRSNFSLDNVTKSNVTISTDGRTISLGQS